MVSPEQMREHFMLDPEVIFLNHGSFGATPRVVFETYQNWQRQLEHQPVKFLGREVSNYLKEAREALGTYLNVPANDLIYVPNATFGVNIVARSLNLKEGDEVLTCDQEYGACNNAWTFLSQKKGFSYLKAALPTPVESNEAIIEALWEKVNERTKVIYLSHITSPTALILPIKEICHRARREGILTLIDGAHAPGQLELDLSDIAPDFYTGNCHKWLCSPKGAGFLYSRNDCQDLIEPLVVSWGWTREPRHSAGSIYLDNFNWTGTNDPAGYLSVPSAIAFQAEHDWQSHRQACHKRLSETLEAIEQLTGQKTFYPIGSSFYRQLAIAALPDLDDPETFKNVLYDKYRIEIPVTQHLGRNYVRISVQAYTSSSDLEALVNALAELLA
ncbi:MAG: aminotransferase class V-fold PLP-dependent enzyme [Trueperaceae bacterium]|nr:aminotransferase class V-fold PLP-dependent enzyme [Trueperaceae bacterium]